MHNELTNRNNSPPQFESLLQPLLQAGFEPSRKFAMGMLRAPSRTTPNRRPYTLAGHSWTCKPQHNLKPLACAQFCWIVTHHHQALEQLQCCAGS
jgi:hypothetical protein